MLGFLCVRCRCYWMLNDDNKKKKRVRYHTIHIIWDNCCSRRRSKRKSFDTESFCSIRPKWHLNKQELSRTQEHIILLSKSWNVMDSPAIGFTFNNRCNYGVTKWNIIEPIRKRNRHWQCLGAHWEFRVSGISNIKFMPQSRKDYNFLHKSLRNLFFHSFPRWSSHFTQPIAKSSNVNASGDRLQMVNFQTHWIICNYRTGMQSIVKWLAMKNKNMTRNKFSYFRVTRTGCDVECSKLFIHCIHRNIYFIITVNGWVAYPLIRYTHST